MIVDCGMPDNHKDHFHGSGSCNNGHPPKSIKLSCGGGRLKLEMEPEQAEQQPASDDKDR
jgi:hypothetical protein